MITFDSELSVYISKKLLNSSYKLADNRDVNEYVILGTSTGQVIFLSFENLFFIYARINVATCKIKQIEALKDVYLTLSEINTFFVWTVRNRKMEMYHELKLGANFSHFSVLENRIFLAYLSGDQELLHWDEPNLHVVQFLKEFDHEKKINSSDAIRSKKLMMTCSDDGSLKIWNYRRQLIRQVRFPYKLPYACFMNFKGDILVCYQNIVSVIPFNTYWPKGLREESADEFLIKVTGDDIAKELAKVDNPGFVFIEEKKTESIETVHKESDLPLKGDNRNEEVKLKRINDAETLFKLSLNSTNEPISKYMSFNSCRSKQVMKKVEIMESKEKKIVIEEDKEGVIGKVSKPESRVNTGKKTKEISINRKKQVAHEPARKRQYMTRREVTEAKIVNNILNWNTPAKQPNLKGLHIHGKNPSKQPK